MTNYSRQLAAIMFTDIVGYTSLMGRNEEKALQLLQKNREIHKPLIEKYKGKWVKEMGDGVLAQFDSAYNATKCAIEIQQKAKREFKGQLRIGLHIGEIIVENDDIFGDGVNVASRIESMADPNGIYLSEAVEKPLQNHTDIQTRYLGEVTLKNVDQPVKLYCIVAEDVAVPNEKKIQQIRHQVEEEQKKTFFHQRPVFYFLVALLLIFLIAINQWYDPGKVRTVEAIAVLPFANFTGSEDEQYFVDMMHDAVIGELSKIGDLIVKSRTSTLQFRDTKLTIPEIARILDVDAIMESSVFKTGDSVIMQVQLIQARPKEDHIWAQNYERDTKHVLSLYGELAKKVANEVEIQLTPLEERQFTQKKEVNPEAYKAYLKGRFHWNKLSREDLEIAENYFNLAREIEPDYALAYIGLASLGGGRAQMGLIPSHESVINGAKYLEKAYQLDSTESELFTFYAGFKCWGLWDFHTSRTMYEHSLRIRPNDAFTKVYYAHVLCFYNELEKALNEGGNAVILDPYNNLIRGVYGMTLNFCREYDKADSLFNNILIMDPYNSIALSNIKTTYHLKGEYEKAIEIWKIDHRNDPEALSVIDQGYKEGGYSQALKNLAELMVKRSKDQFITPWRICTIYTRAGIKDEALNYLEKAYDVHDPNMPYIITDPIFDYLRDDPRFQLIIEKMNFPTKS